MPKTVEELEKELGAKIDAVSNEVKAANTSLQETLAKLPGMSKAHASEFHKESLKTISELQETLKALADPESKKKQEKPSELDDLRKKIEALTLENKKAQEDKELETRKAEIARELSKFKIVKGLEDYAHSDLLKLVSRNEKGELVLNFKDKIGETEIDKQLNVKDGVERFLKGKLVFLQADVKGGSGAGGGSVTGGVKPTWDQMNRNPALHWEWKQKDPEYVRSEEDKHIAALEATRGKRQ